jgi:hypothetical protein
MRENYWMEELSHNSSLLTRYLLGDLPQAERDLLEEIFFSDNDLFIELLDAKDQLLSDYLGGRLSPDNLKRFEQCFLTLPDCRREFELAYFLQQPSARLLLNEQLEPEGEAPSWWKTILDTLRAHRSLVGLTATAVLILGIVSVWSAGRFISGNQHSAGAPTKSVTNGPAVVSLSLKPSLRRGAGETPKAVVGPATQAVELNLETLAEIYPGYQASLLKEGEQVPELVVDGKLKAETGEGGSRLILVLVPATKLSINDYQISLNGINADNSTKNLGTYHFKVREQ